MPKTDYSERAAKKGSKKLWKKIKALHPATKAIAVLCLVLGLAVGAIFCLASFKNDHFVLKGQTNVSIQVGDTYTYTEEGVDAVCFGRDVSGKLQVETDLEQDANGRYIIPTDKEGVYTITYTVDCFKFGEKAPNGVIKRIRVFTVDAVEEDGRSADLSEEVSGSGT